MNTIYITVVRIYMDAEDTGIKVLMKRLHDWEKLRGMSVFEGLAGFGRAGLPESLAKLPTPIAVEFFDTPEKIDSILEDLSGFIPSEHIIIWDAKLIVGTKGAA